MPFFLVFGTLVFLGCTYIALRLIMRTSLRGYTRVLAYALCYVPLLHLPLRHHIREISRAGEVVAPWLDVVFFTSQIFLGALSLMATVVLIYDFFLLGKWLYTKIFIKTTSTAGAPVADAPDSEAPVTQEPINTSRRLFVQNSVSAGILAASGGLLAYSASEALFVPEVKHVRVPVEHLPPEFHGYRIAHITDLHINRPVPVSRMEGIVEKIHALSPHSIAITGDLSDSYPHQVEAELKPLASLRAPDGVFFVDGNHEYYTNISQWLRAVNRLGLDHLYNEHRLITRGDKRLLMCGVPDYRMASMSSAAEAQEGSREGDIKILLSHQPQNIYEASKVGYDVHLCGHTHGGQLFPWTYVVDLAQPYIHGLYTVEKTKLYVNRGAGFWGPPLRLGAPPEIALIELVPQG